MSNIIDILSLSNYWDKPPAINLGQLRNSYLKLIKDSVDNKLIKVIAGQRRTGKSYIIRQLINNYINEAGIEPQNIFYLNKESYELDSIKNDRDLFQLIKTYKERYRPRGKIFYFFDEVQEIKNWEKLVVSLAQDSLNSAEIFVTGSNSSLLSGELATKLSGRYIYFEVFPFSYKEFLEYHQQSNNRQNFINYVNTSGLPETFNLNNQETIRFYFKSLKDTILLQDIMNRYNIRDAALLEDLFLFLIHNLGNLTSIPSIIKYFKSKNRKTDYSTISNYLSYIENTYIIHSSPRYYLKKKETLSGEQKYYINDLGFRNYLYPNMLHEVGSGLENIVHTHLLKSGYEVFTGYGPDFEIDFLAVKPTEKIYIQVCYLLENKSTIEREFGVYSKVKDFYPKYVLSMDEIPIQDYLGIRHLTLWDFLYL